MRSIVINFLSLEVLNLHPAIYWGLGGVWLLILISAFMSIRSLSINISAKVAWFLVIIAIPIFGLTAYALRCIFHGNWQILKPLFQTRKMS